MDLHFPLYAIPSGLTLLIVLIFLFLPERRPRGDYDFGGQIDVMLQLFGTVVAILVVWLIYAIIV